MKPVRSAAHRMLSAIFVVSGVHAVASPEGSATVAKRVTDPVTPVLEKIHPRFPTDPRTLVRVNGVVQITAGLLLASGRLTRLAAAALAGSLVPTTLAGHPFWDTDNPTDRRAQEIHFLKNLGLLGGLLVTAVDTQGRPGLRWRAGHAARQLGHSAWHARHAARHAEHSARHGRRSIRRTLDTARRDARIALRSAVVARRLPG